jgi:very-short-patch-repair endonuclease
LNIDIAYFVNTTWDNRISNVGLHIERNGGSPIEVLFGQAFFAFYACQREADHPGLWFVPQERIAVENYQVSITPQFLLNGHRFDFLIRTDLTQSKQWLDTLIECDGHDFHERTQDQALRDRRNDRDAQAAGFPILRFTGREIFREPMRCAEEAWQFIGGREITRHRIAKAKSNG